jgi:hypothetical protein
MSTLAEFITGTVNESLKKLVQPVGLVPAAIFVLLNLAFVYPGARAEGVPLAKAFAALDAPTQAAIVALITLALGYFLLSASTTILDILGGDLIRGSVVHSLLVWRQRRRRDYLIKTVPNSWYVSKRFYVPSEGEKKRDPLPSALGNVLVATQGRLARRYGIDMAALWSMMVATPALKELPARTVVEDERAARDTLGNTAFVLWLFGLEGLVFFTFRSQPGDALLSLIALPAGYVVYRFAVAKAHAWGSAVETLFDLHRDKLHDALKLATYGSLSSEQRVWQQAGQFFVNSAGYVSADDVFQKEDAPSVTAVPSGDLVVRAPVSAVVDGPRRHGDAVWLRWVEYVVLVAKESTASDGTAAEVLVDDPRVARIDPPVSSDRSLNQPQVVRTDDGRDQLLWTLEDLSPGDAVSLRYEVPLFTLNVEPADQQLELKLLPGVGFSVAVPDAVGSLSVTCSGTGECRPELRLDNTARRPTRIDGRRYEWRDRFGESVWLVLPDQVT